MTVIFIELHSRGGAPMKFSRREYRSASATGIENGISWEARTRDKVVVEIDRFFGCMLLVPYFRYVDDVGEGGSAPALPAGDPEN